MRGGGPRPVSAEPVLIASGTRPRPACRGRARAALPPPARRSLFERLLRRLVRLRVLGSHRQAGEAQPAQHLADRALVQPDREAGLDQGLEVDPPPPHHAVPLRVRPPLHDVLQLGLLLGRQPRPRPRAAPVAQPGQPLLVVPVHPVAQGLPVHAGVPRRLHPRGALQHEGERQHAARRLRVPAPARLPPRLGRARLLPRDRHRHGPLRRSATPPIDALGPRAAPRA